MKKIHRKIFLLALSIVFLLLTTATFTFSWLSINTSAYVTNLELEVSQGDGILASIDGQNFYSEIDSSQIKQAVVMKYLGYSYEDGVLVDENSNKVDLLDSEIETYFNNLKFDTVTTMDGKKFYGYNSSSTDVTDGSYIMFDLWFKGEQDDTSIYFNYSKVNYDSDGELIKNTSISGTSVTTTSDSTKASYLAANLTTLDSEGNALVVKSGSEGLEINSKNAMRFSTNVNDEIKIYEPNIGLGSYATDLDSSNYQDMYLESSYYDSNKNAAFTYINNLKPSSQLEALSYSDIPYTYKDFYTYEADHIVTIDSMNDAQKVTFTFWLEGWDADCFDAIVGQSTTISLAFTTNIVTMYQVLQTVNYHNGDDTITFNYYDYESINPYLPYTSEGKKFKGWYTDETYTEKFDFDSIIETSLVTEYDCYALWSE